MNAASTDPRRVALVVWWFDEFGGMEEQVTALACALARRGVEVAVLSEMPLPRSNVYARRLRAAGIRIRAPGPWLGWIRSVHASRSKRRRRLAHRLETAWLDIVTRVSGGLPLRGGEDPWVADARRNLLGAALLRRLEHERRRRPPDLVHVHGCRLGQVWVSRWARDHGIASAYTEHLTIESWGGPEHPGAGAALCESAGAVACVSERARQSLQAYLPPGAEVSVVGHIVTAPDRRAIERREPEPEGVSLLCVARLSRPKGIDVLLRAFARVVADGAAVRLSLVGDGPERGALEELRAALGLGERVRFVGAVAREAVAGFLDAADLVVLPSRTEGLPVVLLEAMARGKAIVASRTGGIPEVIEDGRDGRLVEPDDVRALARGLGELVADRDLRDRLARHARLTFERGGWSEAAVLEEVGRLYRRAVRRTKPESPPPAADALAAMPLSSRPG